MTRPNIAALTSSRFIAALAVVIFHYDKNQQLFPMGVCTFGYGAVTFFFILSGFILTYTHGTPGGLNVSIRRFTQSRLLKILPAYYLALIIALPFLLSALHRGAVDWGLLLVPALLQSWFPPAALYWNIPAWSLSNEIFFYALFPAIWWAFRRASPITLIASTFGMILAVDVLRAALPTTEYWFNFSAYFPLFTLPQFMLGVAMGRLYLLRGAMPQSNAVFITTSAALCIIVALQMTNSAVLSLVFGLMIYAMADLKGYALNVMSVRPLVALGNASYALYILHVPVWLWWDRIARVMLHLDWPAGLDFAAYLFVAVGLSIAVTSYLERPIMRMFKPIYGVRIVAAPLPANATKTRP